MSTKIKELEEQLKKEKSKQLFVRFISPGTFVSETTSEEIEKRDLKAATQRAKLIKERYNATPFGFQFTDGNGVVKGGTYYITGRLIKYDEVPNIEDNWILLSNMRNNGYPIIIENTNSYKTTTWFNEEDCIVDWDGYIIQKGDSPDLKAYRTKKLKEFKNKSL